MDCLCTWDTYRKPDSRFCSLCSSTLPDLSLGEGRLVNPAFVLMSSLRHGHVEDRRAEVERRLAPLRTTYCMNKLTGWKEYGLNEPGGNLPERLFSMC
jgi:hypothetical protein